MPKKFCKAAGRKLRRLGFARTEAARIAVGISGGVNPGPKQAPFPSFWIYFAHKLCSFTHFFRDRLDFAILGKPGILRGCTKRFCTLLGGGSQGRVEQDRAKGKEGLF